MKLTAKVGAYSSIARRQTGLARVVSLRALAEQEKADG